ncbi:MAG TPA: hypothetical protein VM487_01975 [Phycisphaerae bacterium]|nr:hypothetical protein [Phycisphaerae bacterium]
MRQKFSAFSSRKLLPGIARARLAELRASGVLVKPPGIEALPIGEFIEAATPGYLNPTHLPELTQTLELAEVPDRHGQLLFWLSVPPRHYKSETLKHAIIRRVMRHPTESVAYCAYTSDLANKQNRSMRRLAKTLGLELAKDSSRQDEWETVDGGGVVARGVGGGLTGYGFSLIVVDDPIKGREKAESSTERDRVWEWLNDDVITRLTPNGVLVLVHTRWHPDDPIGRAKLEPTWNGVNLPALGGPAENVPLLPDVWGLDHLARIRQRRPFTFSALYQGEPRPRGGKVFGEPHWYDPETLPKVGYSLAHGVDLAYTARTHSDWSVCFTLLRSRDTYYVLDVKREQMQQPDFAGILKTQHNRYPGAMRWYAAGTEKVAADFLATLGVPLQVEPASADKFVRAQPLADAWNDGRVLLPAGIGDEPPPEWVEDLISEFANFTGVGDKHDDIVDAAAAGFDVLTGGRIDIDEDFMDSLPNVSRWGDDCGRGFG